MKIDKSMNIVVDIEREDGEKLYIHSIPISRIAFEENWDVIARTFAVIYQQGVGVISGPRVAALALRKIARDLGREEQVESGLLREVRRLTNMVYLDKKEGWISIPYDEALKHDRLSEEEVAEVENAVIFFTVLWHMHRRNDALRILPGMLSIWDAHLESSNSTAFASSLRTSTETGNSERPGAA